MIYLNVKCNDKPHDFNNRTKIEFFNRSHFQSVEVRTLFPMGINLSFINQGNTGNSSLLISNRYLAKFFWLEKWNKPDHGLKYSIRVVVVVVKFNKNATFRFFELIISFRHLSFAQYPSQSSRIIFLHNFSIKIK